MKTTNNQGGQTMLEYRLIFSDPDEEEKAIKVLDETGNDYDHDSGDRMMVDQDGLDALAEAGIDYTEV
jgi:hypothetical protein